MARPTEKSCLSRWFAAAGLRYQQSPGIAQGRPLRFPRANISLPIWRCLEGCTCSEYKGIPAYSHTGAGFPGHPPAPHQSWWELLHPDHLRPLCINQSPIFRTSPKLQQFCRARFRFSDRIVLIMTELISSKQQVLKSRAETLFEHSLLYWPHWHNLWQADLL